MLRTGGSATREILSKCPSTVLRHDVLAEFRNSGRGRLLGVAAVFVCLQEANARKRSLDAMRLPSADGNELHSETPLNKAIGNSQEGVENTTFSRQNATRAR